MLGLVQWKKKIYKIPMASETKIIDLSYVMLYDEENEIQDHGQIEGMFSKLHNEMHVYETNSGENICR